MTPGPATVPLPARNIKQASNLNVNHNTAALYQLQEAVLSQSIDVVSLNEQRVREGKIVGRPDGFSEVMFSERSRAALWVSPRLKYCVVLITDDIVAIRCFFSNENVLIVSCYCSPSEDIVPILTRIGDLLLEFPQDNLQIVGDFNAKSYIWGDRPTDARGEEVISFAHGHDLEIINDPDCAATFDGHQGQSWIDFPTNT